MLGQVDQFNDYIIELVKRLLDIGLKVCQSCLGWLVQALTTPFKPRARVI